MARSVPDFEGLLRALVRHGVDFIVVGGVSAALQGAPLMTMDLDIVHRRDPENIDRLLGALKSLGAFYRSSGPRELVPGRTHLRSEGHQLLMTDSGPLDVLGTIGANRSYDDLLPLSCELEVGDLTVRVLSLSALIRVKEEVGQPKDRAMLDLLRETLREDRDAKA